MDFPVLFLNIDEEFVYPKTQKVRIKISKGDDYPFPPEPVQQMFHPKLHYFNKF